MDAGGQDATGYISKSKQDLAAINTHGSALIEIGALTKKNKKKNSFTTDRSKQQLWRM